MGIYFDPIEAWPEAFKGFNRRPIREETREVSTRQLSAAHTYYNQLTQPEPSDLDDMLLAAMKSLTPKERAVIKDRFGLDGKEPLWLGPCASRNGYGTIEGARQCQNRALAKMKHVLEQPDSNEYR